MSFQFTAVFARLSLDLVGLPVQMLRVKQEDATGCGIACAAMIANISYIKARQVAIEIGVVAACPPHYTTSKDLRNLISSLGFRTKQGRKLRHWSSLNCLSIVGINYNVKNGNWHWVVFVPDKNGGYVLDPRASVKTDRRLDFARMRPSRYIPVDY